ncbi:MAG: UbiD family decarboxylase [Candidatus Nanohalarchaeota archaeon]|nr:MAG: UbiD family decarboxylase [Candidatus Nanohaloarchaeota archaeon]
MKERRENNMELREFIDYLDKRGQLKKIKKNVSSDCEIANILYKLDGKPVLFEKVDNQDINVVSGLCSSPKLIAESLNIAEDKIVQKMIDAIDKPKEPKIIEKALCQEVEISDVDLFKFPFLFHKKEDGGRYLTCGVCIIKDKDNGVNMCIHRLMVVGKNKLVGRIIEERGTDLALKKNKNLEIAVCIGNSVSVLLAAATSIAKDKSELGMANALEYTPLVKCKTIDLEVPADCEIVLEGEFTGEYVDEGPFLDLTETYDIVRRQPVIKIKHITTRKNPVYQALLPGKSEHKLLMGMPREPTIFKEVNKVCKCLDVCITPGGCSWLHAVVKIEKKNKDDAVKAIDACFIGHKSLKHCIIVDEDINIRNPASVESAIATRFQADKDLYIFKNQKGSSLDLSSDLSSGKARTTKAGIDATIPAGVDKSKFKKEGYPDVDLKKYL